MGDTVDFKTIFNSLAGYFIVLKPNAPHYSVLAISDELLWQIHRERENVEGKSVRELYNEKPGIVSKTEHSLLSLSLEKALQHKKPNEEIFQLEWLNGSASIRENSWSVKNKPVLNEEGEVVYLLQTFTQITDRRDKAVRDKPVQAKQEAERKEWQIKSLVESSPFPVGVYMGKEMRLTYINQPMMDLCGKGKELIGELYHEVLSKMGQEIVRGFEEVRRSGKAFHSRNEYVVVKIDGKPKSYYYYDFSFTPLVDEENKVYGVLNTAVDVTKLKLAHQKIENNAKDLSKLANAMPQYVWIADRNGELSFYNNWVSKFADAGRFTDEKWGWKKILHPDDLAATEEAWAVARREGFIFEIEHRIRMKDGTYRWHLSRALPQPDVEGAVEKWYGTATDIHMHKENEEALRRSEEQLRLAVEAADLGIFYFYPQKNELFWSKKTKEIIGLPPEEAASEDKFWESFHPEERERNALLIQRAYQAGFGGGYENEFRIVRFSDKETRWMRSKGQVSFDDKGKPFRFLGVTQDITERKKAEEDLALKNAQLTRINKDLDNFVYTALHDLKAPINHVEGLLRVLLMELPAEVLAAEEFQTITSLMQQAVERFQKTITSLAEVVKHRNEVGGEVVAVELPEVVQEVLVDMEPMIRETGARVEVALEDCPMVLLSKKNLRSVVYNLLSNAIKYRSSRREPRVEISCERDQQYHILTFKDNGMGMEEESVRQLFTMFKRFHTHVEGTGIGLFMVRRMVENAGGYIEVESQLGQGSTFRVYLLAE